MGPHQASWEPGQECSPRQQEEEAARGGCCPHTTPSGGRQPTQGRTEVVSPCVPDCLNCFYFLILSVYSIDQRAKSILTRGLPSRHQSPWVRPGWGWGHGSRDMLVDAAEASTPRTLCCCTLRRDSRPEDPTHPRGTYPEMSLDGPTPPGATERSALPAPLSLDRLDRTKIISVLTS